MKIGAAGAFSIQVPIKTLGVPSYRPTENALECRIRSRIALFRISPRLDLARDRKDTKEDGYSRDAEDQNGAAKSLARLGRGAGCCVFAQAATLRAGRDR
jgi:hypothetical protein